MSIDAQTLLSVIIVGVVAGCVGALSDRTSAISYLIAGIVGGYGAIWSAPITPVGYGRSILPQ